MIRFYKIIEGVKVYSTNPQVIGNNLVYNPTEAMLLADGWTKENWEPEPIPIEVLRQQALNELSNYSLTTMDRFVKQYQFLNAQASLLVEDGQGIYTHEQARKVILEYNTIGQLCRNKFYEAKGQIDVAESATEIDSIVEATKKYYDELTYDDIQTYINADL